MRPEQNNGCPRNRLANAGQKSIAFAKRFGREEDGVMVAFALMMLIAMLMVGGIGIDLMRFEMDRTRLQNTLDRAVLAAADLDQTLDAKEVVQDYFSKAGLSEYLSGVRVQEGLGSKRVEADAETTFDTFFLKLMGVETLTATANGAAMETIDGLEISLVLDVSGSMNSNQRLIRLKPAAKEFVETILSSNDSGNVSISIIPYATQVSGGAQILDKWDVSDEHSYSHCINFNADEFSHTELHTTSQLERTAHFDPFTYSEDPIEEPVCPVEASREILPLSNNLTELQNYIDSLVAHGNTSIDLGVKWGTLLLDPDMEDLVSQLIDEGAVGSDMLGRPVAYGSGGLMKIIVLMSDGENTNQYLLNPSLREGLSPVYYNAEADKYSVYQSSGNSHSSNSSNSYYWPHTDDWYDHPYGNGSTEVCNGRWVRVGSGRGSYWYWDESCDTITEPGEAVRLTYPELFNRVSLAWNAEYNYADMSNAWGTWYTAAFSKINSTAKDQRTKHICGAAKDAGIIVYTIGFEAPKDGLKVLRDCASSDGHYFDVDGLEIEDAFSSIAASIRKLKLIQ
ncbi:TadE/TadG family type IV pilus assembly protein [Thalassovita sp.]|uniref:TadE/TadG family type IV pilus assembly protein n=1 Tax=Thalassovita sp. TaxID=1979401 RepID=UPI0029DE7197|nr:TadE/TadG family type IV pilus assembly protein [Thalassovita sp.]